MRSNAQARGSLSAYPLMRFRQMWALGAAGLVLLGLAGCGANQQSAAGGKVLRQRAWQLHEYRLFRTSPEVPPLAIRDALGSAFSPTWSAAQLVPGPKGGDYWLVPDRQRICMLADAQERIATACAGPNVASRHGIAIVLISPRAIEPLSPRRRIVGVAPNGITHVQLHDGSHLMTSLPVSRNGIFEVTDSGTNPPKSITFRH